MRAWFAIGAIAAGAFASVQQAGAQTGVEPPAARVAPVLESRCRARLACWIDHWGYRRCSRRWVCSDERGRNFRRRPQGPRRYSLEDDYAPESGFRRDREPSLRRYRGSEEPVAPEIVRPFRRNRPSAPQRQRVTVRPRLKEVPNRDPAADPDTEARKPADPETNPKAESNRRDKRETALRREEPSAPNAQPNTEPRVEVIPRPEPAPKSRPDTGPKVEVIPRPQTAPPEKESARLKEPPAAPPKPDTEAPAPVKLTPLPVPPGKAPARPTKKSEDRKTDAVPDDIDKLPRGRKTPMDEIDPPNPKKTLPERMPI